MDYEAAINRVYDHLENDDVDKAVMTCLRIARNLQDHLYAAIFLRELYPVRRDFLRVMHDDTSHLKEEAQEFLDKTSLDYWLDSHTLNYNLAVDDDGAEKNVLAIGVGEIKGDLDQWERSIEDLKLPSGMGEFDTAAFTDRYNNKKEWIRLRIRAVQTIKERIKTKCLNYAIRIEKQIQSQKKSETFLQESYNEVNNYFKAHSEDVYTKLQKASQLVGSNDPEDFSLLLTQVRRAIKAVADFFYPQKEEPTKCSDGQVRDLGNEQYLNRLQEFLLASFEKSSSRDLLKAEFEYLSVFARRLHEVASKGVHSEVTIQDAKQGIIGLYMFLYNIIVRIQAKDS
ncbi:MAG: hypothetical protein KKG88_10425 [Proteobacteria bacterium]|nr:hypothetical protein [Pseudomonadota bacterium]